MDPQTGASGSPPSPVPLEQLGGAAGAYEEEAGGLPTPSDLGQLGAAARAAGPPEPTALEQVEAGPEAPPEPASPEELAAMIEGASSG